MSHQPREESPDWASAGSSAPGSPPAGTSASDSDEDLGSFLAGKQAHKQRLGLTSHHACYMPNRQQLVAVRHCACSHSLMLVMMCRPERAVPSGRQGHTELSHHHCDSQWTDVHNKQQQCTSNPSSIHASRFKQLQPKCHVRPAASHANTVPAAAAAAGTADSDSSTFLQ